MNTARRLIPSTAALRALEAVDRLGSASAAAQELSLTHGAVSRQIKVLEGQLGLQLVQRGASGLILTPAARDYCTSIRNALHEISRASIRLRANPSGGGLQLAVLPSFAMHCLAPLLPEFAKAHPEITLNMSTRLVPFDFHHTDFDAAIHCGQKDWQGVHYLPLKREYVQAVAAPNLISFQLERAEQILEFPLLQLETRPKQWESWFEAHNLQVGALPGILFDQFSTMAAATAHGSGIALLPSFIADAEIELGRLTPAFGDAIEVADAYYLVWPKDKPTRPALQTFVTWLSSCFPRNE